MASLALDLSATKVNMIGQPGPSILHSRSNICKVNVR